jgi:hypothetical protein
VTSSKITNKQIARPKFATNARRITNPKNLPKTFK